MKTENEQYRSLRAILNLFLITVLAVALSGCDSLFVEPAYFPAEDYADEIDPTGELNKAQYELYLKWQNVGYYPSRLSAELSGNCAEHAYEFYQVADNLGLHPIYIRVYLYGSTTDHAAVLVGEYFWDNGKMAGGEPVHVNDMDRIGEWDYMSVAAVRADITRDGWGEILH